MTEEYQKPQELPFLSDAEAIKLKQKLSPMVDALVLANLLDSVGQVVSEADFLKIDSIAKTIFTDFVKFLDSEKLLNKTMKNFRHFYDFLSYTLSLHEKFKDKYDNGDEETITTVDKLAAAGLVYFIEAYAQVKLTSAAGRVKDSIVESLIRLLSKRIKET